MASSADPHSEIVSGPPCIGRLVRYHCVLDTLLSVNGVSLRLEDVREKLLSAWAVSREIIDAGGTDDPDHLSVAESLVNAGLQLWLAAEAADTDKSDERLEELLRSTARFDSCFADYWSHQCPAEPDDNSGSASGPSWKILRDRIESVYSLERFEEIRDVRLLGRCIEVRGTVLVDRLPESLRQKALPYVTDGFVYAAELYELTDDAVDYRAVHFQQDPWLQCVQPLAEIRQ